MAGKRVRGLLGLGQAGGWNGNPLARRRPFLPRRTPIAVNTPTPHEIVTLFDVDNTLLDNDRLIADLREHLTQAFGVACSGRYWTIFERLRDELGYADYLGALQLYRAEVEGRGAQAQALLQMSGFLVDYPFADRLFPGALDAVARMRRLGPCVILSDGDVVFQPRKVQRSGLWQAVEGRVLIYVHKERRLDEVRRTFPARRYLLVDDKPRILGAVKAEWREDVVTVFPRQGHYAADAAEVARHPRPDVVIDRIGELARMNLAARLPAAGAPNDTQHAAAT